MIRINKFENMNENTDSKKKEYPYELTSSGELKKVFKEKLFSNIKYVYLTDWQYDKLKKLSDNTKMLCDNFDDMKRQYILILKAAIQKVKEDDK